MAAARRWVLFGLAMASLAVMTYAGVLLAFSVPVSGPMLAANSDLPESGRVIVAPIAGSASVKTHEATGEGALLVAGEGDSYFPVSATNVSMRRALAYVSPTNGSYSPAQRTILDVPSRDGSTDLTVDVAALAEGRSGWIVMGANETAPTFYAEDDVLGEAMRFSSTYALGMTFALGAFGFILPLIGLILTHRPSGRRVAASAIVCRECGGAMPTNGEFCLRCGAWRGDME